jgi:RHH-type proline utilization regulon transcriptional repressor/proline dehydrogenase/delta 1-pyrroline-5-carboxylate dehydrogenase
MSQSLPTENSELKLLAGFVVDAASSYPLEVQQALHVARALGRRAGELQSPQERRQQAELDRMIDSPGDRATLMQLTDQAFRTKRRREPPIS